MATAVFHLDSVRDTRALVDQLERVSESLIDARRSASSAADRKQDLERRLVAGVATKGRRKGQTFTAQGRAALVRELVDAIDLRLRTFARREELTLEFARLREFVPPEAWGERAQYAASDPWLEVNIREATRERAARAGERA